MAQDLARSQDTEAAAAPAAAATEHEAGPGEQALSALLAKGVPDPGAVVALIDAHRGEHDAMFALLHQTLGNAYVQRVVQAMDHLRLSVANKEVAAGDPGDANANYFVAGQAEQGAKWKDGGWTGTIDKNGLDTDVKTAHDDVHAKVGADKTATVDWTHDGKKEGELYGNYKSSKDYEVGVKRDFGDVTAGVHHQQQADGALDGAFASYKHGTTTADASLGVKHGGLVASAKAAGQLDASDKASGSISHDAQGTTISATDTHTFAKDETLTGTVSHDAKGTTETLDGSFQLGAHDKATANVTHDGKGTSLSATDTHTFDKDNTLTGTVSHDAKGTSEKLDGNFKLGAHDTLAGSIAHDPTSTSAQLTEKHTFGDGGTLTSTGKVAHDDKGTTGSLDESYAKGGLKLDGTYTHATDKDSLSLSASDQVNKQLSVSGKLSEDIPRKGKPETTLSLAEQYKGEKVVQGLNLDAGLGDKDYLKATGSLDAQLAPKLYGGAFGSVGVEQGHQLQSQLGASLTFTPNEKTALTLAGVLDQSGALETRLQLDVFKDKVASVGDLADHKKDALVSLFLSYKQGGHADLLGPKFGDPTYTASQPAGGGQVMAGIRFRF